MLLPNLSHRFYRDPTLPASTSPGVNEREPPTDWGGFPG